MVIIPGFIEPPVQVNARHRACQVDDNIFNPRLAVEQEFFGNARAKHQGSADDFRLFYSFDFKYLNQRRSKSCRPGKMDQLIALKPGTFGFQDLSATRSPGEGQQQKENWRQDFVHINKNRKFQSNKSLVIGH